MFINMKFFFVFIIAILLLQQAFAEAYSSSSNVNKSTVVDEVNGVVALKRKHYLPKFNCNYACARRCRKASRKNRCSRACKSCCERCRCVPPGTYGHKNICPCYARLKTHGNKPKCP